MAYEHGMRRAQVLRQIKCPAIKRDKCQYVGNLDLFVSLVGAVQKDSVSAEQ